MAKENRTGEGLMEQIRRSLEDAITAAKQAYEFNPNAYSYEAMLTAINVKANVEGNNLIRQRLSY